MILATPKVLFLFCLVHSSLFLRHHLSSFIADHDYLAVNLQQTKSLCIPLSPTGWNISNYSSVPSTTFRSDSATFFFSCEFSH